MKIYLTDQSRKFPQHLQRLQQVAVMPYDITKLKAQRSQVTIDVNVSLAQLKLDCLYDYRIFPGNIMTGLPQWLHEGRSIRAGDTIVQQVFIPPFGLSQKVVFGVRIKEVIDGPTRKGYSYETLEGHVERGISTFTVEPAADGTVTFVIHTYSAPATTLTRLLGPVFSVPYQAYCTRHALQHVKSQLELR